MTKLNHERKGPPRPGSGLGHPFGGERPYVHVTDEDRKRRRLELAEEHRRRAARLPYWDETEAAIEARLVELRTAGEPLNSQELDFLAERERNRATAAEWEARLGKRPRLFGD